MVSVVGGLTNLLKPGRNWMKRRLLIIAAFLLLGVVVNVAVAWGWRGGVRLESAWPTFGKAPNGEVLKEDRSLEHIPVLEGFALNGIFGAKEQTTRRRGRIIPSNSRLRGLGFGKRC